MEAFALSEPLFVVNPKVIFRNNVYFGCEQDDAMTQRSDLRRASKSWSFAVTPYVFQDIEDATAVAELARGAKAKTSGGLEPHSLDGREMSRMVQAINPHRRLKAAPLPSRERGCRDRLPVRNPLAIARANR